MSNSTPDTEQRRTTHVERSVARRINASLAPKRHFLIAKREGGKGWIGHVLAKGDPTTARYEIVDHKPVDLVDAAFRHGVTLSDREVAALTTARVAA